MLLGTEIAFAGRPVTEEGAGDPAFLAVLACPGHSGCVEHLGADGDGDRGGADIVGNLVDTFITHPVEKDLLHGQSVPEQPRILAVAGDQPVIPVQAVGGGERSCFLADVLGVGAHAAGTLQLEGDLVEMTADRHVFVQLDEVFIGDEVLAEFLVELAVLIQDGYSLDLGGMGGGDRHVADPGVVKTVWILGG